MGHGNTGTGSNEAHTEAVSYLPVRHEIILFIVLFS